MMTKSAVAAVAMLSTGVAPTATFAGQDYSDSEPIARDPE